jgi:cell division protein FtsB
MQTDEYIREVAREKLGLVDKGDIIFRRDDDNK